MAAPREILKTDLDAAGHAVTGLPTAVASSQAVPLSQLQSAIAGLANSSSSVVDAAELVALDTGDGVIRFVSTYRDLFRLDKVTVRTAIDDVILQSSINPLWFWVRLNVPDPYWRTKHFVTIDPGATGNNEHAGFADSMAAADAVPLKSFVELNRRVPDLGFVEDMVIHVLDSVPSSEEDQLILTRLRIQSYDTKIVIIGALTSAARPALHSGTISGYAAAIPASNGDRHLTLAGAPGGLVGNMIGKADGSKWAYILADHGSGSYRISYPRTCDVLTGALGAKTEFANGDSVVVYDLPTLPIYPYPATIFTRDIEDAANGHPGNVILGNFKLVSGTVGERVSVELGGTPSRLINCILQDPMIVGGNNSLWSNILITTGTVGLAFVSGTKGFTIFGLAELGTQMLLRSAELTIQDSHDIQGSSFQTAFAHLHLQAGVCYVSHLVADIGIFGCTQPLVTGDLTSSIYHGRGSTRLYGSGNSGAFYGVPLGATWAWRTGQTAVTSAPAPISIGLAAPAYAYADIPLSLVMSQTAVLSI